MFFLMLLIAFIIDFILAFNLFQHDRQGSLSKNKIHHAKNKQGYAMLTQIYHNPRCSKSRATLQLLEDQTGLELEVIKYLDSPPDAVSLVRICEQLDKHPLEIMRCHETPFKQQGLSKSDPRSVTEWCEIMAANPILIERPIVLHEGKAAIGRPPESVLSIL